MPEKPDWTYWQQMPRAEVWQAVAISMDLCPKQGSPIADYSEFRQRINLYRKGAVTALRQFQDRLDIAFAHIAGDILPRDLSYRGTEHDRVSLSGFVGWAIDRSWDLPAELIAIGRQAAAPSVTQSVEGPSIVNDDPEPHPRTRNNYLRLIYSLALTVPGFDASRPRQAAKVIREATECGIDEKTLAGFITDARLLAQKDQDLADD